MFLEKGVLAGFKYPGGHGLVLDSHVGQQSGRKAGLRIHGPQPLHIEGGDGVAAFPQGLELAGGEDPQGGQQPLGIREKPGQALGRQSVPILPHLLGGGNQYAHRATSC